MISKIPQKYNYLFSLMEGLWVRVMSQWIIKMLNIPFQCDDYWSFASFISPFCFSFFPFSMNRYHGTLESIRRTRFLTKLWFYLCDLEHINFPFYFLLPSSYKELSPFTSKVVFIYNISVTKQICVYVYLDPQQSVVNSSEKLWQRNVHLSHSFKCETDSYALQPGF